MAALLAGVAIFAQTPLPEPAPHPRLFLSDRDFDEIRARVAATGTGDHASPHHTALAAMHELIMRRASTVGLDPSPISYSLDESGLRLLDTSRSALERILLCSYAFRFTGESRFLDHATSDLLSVCRFSDWNAAEHFLDTAEMALAVAIGYDWLYDHLSSGIRNELARALVRNAFVPSADEQVAWFYYAEGNWNQICNAGLAAAAVAVHEVCDTTAQRIIGDAIWSNRRAMQAIYSPSGCYVEGPNYWNYGNAFQVLLLTLFEKSFGDDFGLSSIEGFLQTAQYKKMTHRPYGGIFNYSDNVNVVKPSYALWYFADKIGDESLVSDEMEMLLGSCASSKGSSNGKDGAGGKVGVRYDDSSEVRLLPLLMTYLLKDGPSKGKTFPEVQAGGSGTSEALATAAAVQAGGSGTSEVQATAAAVQAGGPGASEALAAAAAVQAGGSGTSEALATAAAVHTGGSGTSEAQATAAAVQAGGSGTSEALATAVAVQAGDSGTSETQAITAEVHTGRPGTSEDRTITAEVHTGASGTSETQAIAAEVHTGCPGTSARPQIYINRGRPDVLEDMPLMIVKGSDYYLGVKGGSPTANHAHMDGGSFVYDAFGQVWAIDPDRDSYQELEAECKRLGGNFWDMSQESVRWQMPGMNNRSHSTITVNDRDFNVKGKAELTGTIASNGAILDLSSLYEGELAAAERRISVDGNGNLTVEDRLTALPGKDADIRWSFVTPAEVTVSRRGIRLRSGGSMDRNEGTMVLLRTKSRTRVTYREFPSGSETYRICGFEAKVREGKTVVFRSRIEGK